MVWNYIIPLGIVFFLSLFYGLFRQRLHKPIGFGTYVFVSTGATVLSLIATHIQSDSPFPLLGAIITGIGFLGAGALIKNTDKTTGFTSAASIWLFSIFGMAVGLKEYFLGLLMYSTVWIILGIDLYLEKKSIGAYQKKMTISTNKLIPTEEFEKVFDGHKHKLLSIEVDKKGATITAVFLIEGTKEEINTLAQSFLAQNWFVGCKVE